MATIYVSQSGNDTTGDGSVGNPYATLGKAGSVFAAGDTIFLKYSATPYELTTATANVAGGRFSFTGGSDGTLSFVVGYDTNDTLTNTDANRPVIKIPDSGIDSIAVITTGSYSGVRVRNLIVDGNGKTSVTGFTGSMGGGAFHVRCEARNCTIGFNGAKCRNCLADACGTGFDKGQHLACISRGHTSFGFLLSNGVVSRCLATGGVGASADGFRTNDTDGFAGYMESCLAYDNGRDGFSCDGFARGAIVNCISVRNGRYGYRTDGNTATTWLHSNASYENTSGNSLTYANQSENLVLLSAYPFVDDPPSGLFVLNDTAGGGALLRASGFPGLYLDGVNQSFLDIGALQHEDAGGGGGGEAVFSPLRSHLIRRAG